MVQILLTDLRKIELSLFRTEVDLAIRLHTGLLRIEETPSNERIIREIFLPEKGTTPELVFGVAATILKVVSAYPEDQFLTIIEKRMKLGLPRKTNPHAPYDVLFQEFYSEDDYEALHKLAVGSGIEVPAFTTETHIGLTGVTGIHKDYDPAKSRQAVENRYRRSPKLLKITLPRLMKDDNFRSVVATLREERWKDWYILLATGGVRLNFAVDELLPKKAGPEEHKQILNKLMDCEESESDPAPPAEIFTIEKLRFALKLSQFSTLKSMGFDCWQQTPVTDAVDAFLRRFNYWTDDAPHPDPFLLQE